MEEEYPIIRNYFCGVDDSVIGLEQGAVCRWPMQHRISVSVHSYLPGLSSNVQRDTHRAAWHAWTTVSGVKHTFLEDNTAANVEIRAARIGGPGGTLARALLPCGGVGTGTRLWQEYDTGDRWANERCPSGNQIDLLAVAIHETGHSLGIGHGPRGNIMAPSYTCSTTFGAWDKEEITQRYPGTGGTPTDLTVDELIRRAITFLQGLQSG